MAGVKGKSGRKPFEGSVRLHALVDSAVSDKVWINAITKLAEKMEQGDYKAFQILAAYRFGLPREQVEEGAQGGVLVLRMPERELHKRPRIKAIPQRTGPEEPDTENEPTPR